MGPPSETSRRGREDAIETLIDMDPDGAAYRVARTMNGALTSALQGRSNRIPDTALFDAAHALGRYEITLDSPEVLDLYGSSEGVSDDDGSARKEKEQTTASAATTDNKDGEGEEKGTGKEQQPLLLKEGWQTRILRHHDKIIRAKNHSAASGGGPTTIATSGINPSASFTPAGTTGAGGTSSSNVTGTTNNAIPPPALIMALRQIFGSVSSPDLQDLLDKGGLAKVSQGGRETANTLPSLLQAVLNHNVFTGTSSTVPATPDSKKSLGGDSASAGNRRASDGINRSSRRSNVKRDWKSMFDLATDSREGEGEGDVRSEGENSVATSKSGDGDDEIDARATIDNANMASAGADKSAGKPRLPPAVPSAANLESILGNACRDMLYSSGTQNSQVHGLLIALLSVMTGCLFSPEDLESLNFGEVKVQDGSMLTSTIPSTSMPLASTASSSEATDPFANLLQAGALLSVLPQNENKETMEEFALDPKLLQYFVKASSTYEERIEVQKANLFRGQSPPPLVSKSRSEDPSAMKGSMQGGRRRRSSPGVAMSVAELLGAETPNPQQLASIPSRDHYDIDNVEGAANGEGTEDEGKTSDSSDADDAHPGVAAAVSAESSLPELISRPSGQSVESASGISEPGVSSGGEDSSNSELETEASRLLRNIVNIVADEMAEEMANEMEAEGEENASSEDEDEDEDHSEDEDDSDHEEELGDLGDEEDAENDELDEDEHEHDDEEEGVGGEDDEELQRALALSLAAAIAGEGSDSSHSEEEEEESHHSEEGAGSSHASEATTEAATGGTRSEIKAAATATSTMPPPPSKVVRGEKTGKATKKQEGDSIPLPQLPVQPPISLLPNYASQATEAKAEEEEGDDLAPEGGTKTNLQADLSAVFEPSALSNFGKLPASHVLVHLLCAVLSLMQGQANAPIATEPPPPDSEISSTSKIAQSKRAPKKLDSILKNRKEKKIVETVEKEEAAASAATAMATSVKNSFAPDSPTASLLIASLHLSSHLRNNALAVLADLLSDKDGKETDSVIAEHGSGDDDDSIQIASRPAVVGTSAAARGDDDPIVEKEDPASGIGVFVATTDADNDLITDMLANTSSTVSEDLETKGMKRKAAAAAHLASLRYKTKEKLVEIWRARVAFYSSCCLLNLRCLRVFVGKCLQLGVCASDVPTSTTIGTLEQEEVGGQQQGSAVSISTKTRLALLSILSNFSGPSTSASFRSLQASMEQFYSQGGEISAVSLDALQHQLRLVSLCNESLYLWGSAIALLYPDHKARIELLGSMLSSLPARSTISVNNIVSGGRIKHCSWTDHELQRLKLDIFCKRLRVSDMLDFFVASPMVSMEGSMSVDFDHSQAEGGTLSPGVTDEPVNALSTISLLNVKITEGLGGNNLTKFYLALCQRAISNLILWNDLSISSNDANDHDISGGGGAGTSGPGSAGAAWAERGSLQLKLDPTKFHFDATKCADSISVATASPGTPAITANQRATKVWGTVLSTKCFAPKSGVHRWAVKLEKCERGHVFVGVSTARANLKTYVGGDSNGWGLIGTQALWHDRNKIRGDYGSTFRTGAVVVITLDTNVGTLSFGLWKESASSEAAPGLLSPQAMMMASPRRGSTPAGTVGGGGPVIEDWGIAFEGLPLDVKLYPAVGLYQRDDRATLYTVSSPNSSASGAKASSLLPISSGDIYFPLAKADQDHHLSSVRRYNQTLCSDGVRFATEILARAIQLLSMSNKPPVDDVLLTQILPSLASSICLIPSCIPTLSAKYAMELLPLVTRCAKLLDKMIPSKDKSMGIELKEGKWTICVDSSSSDGESKSSTGNSADYMVSLERKSVPGSTESGHSFYQGRSLNKHFSVIGASSGTRIQFVEEWCNMETLEEGEYSTFDDYAQRSSASYVIDARLSLDGGKFEGIRHNVDKGSAERITGHFQQQPITESAGQFTDALHNEITEKWIQTESLLCLAVGHLSLILCSQTSLSDIDKDAVEIPVLKERLESLLSASPILSRGKLDRDGSNVRCAIDSVWERCRSAEMYTDIVEQWQDSIYFDLFSATDSSSSNENASRMNEVMNFIEQRQGRNAAASQKTGSLSRLCPEEYAAAQMVIEAVIFYHAPELRNFASSDLESDITSEASQSSLRIIENGLREALVGAEAGVPKREVCSKRCLLFGRTAQFLLEFPCTLSDVNESMQCIVDDIALIFKSIKTEDDLDYVKQQMNVRTEKGIMRYVGLRSIHLLLQPEDSLEGVQAHAAIESALVSLPRLLASPQAMPTTSSALDVNQGSSTHRLSTIAGCAASIQTCFHLQTLRLYNEISSILSTTADQKPSSLLLGLLASYFTTFRPTEYTEIMLKMLPSLRKIAVHSRDQALLPCDSKDTETPSHELLLNIASKQENKRLLQHSASVLLIACAQLTREPCDSSHLVDILSDQLLQEISETVPFVAASTGSSGVTNLDGVQADWAIYRTSSSGSKAKTDDSHSRDAKSSKGLSYLSSHGTLSMKPPTSVYESPSTSYFGQLLSILHVSLNSQSLIESIKGKASILFSAFGLQLVDSGEGAISSSMEEDLSPMNGVPLKNCRRILRLLRPILLSMETSPFIIQQLFYMAGMFAKVPSDGVHSRDELLLAHSAISLLRYIYTFSKSWRDDIHHFISGYKDSSSVIFCGILTFFGGAPGSLQPGAFVLIEPEIAPLSSSASSIKSRSSASTGAASNAANTSSGSGAEEIVSGLCRHSAPSGVISSVDPRTGSCEVIVVGNKSHVQLPPTTSSDSCLGAPKLTIRAVRVSLANISATNELPLVLEAQTLPAMDLFTPLFSITKTALEAICSTPDKELSDLKPDANTLLECCLSLRSTTVLSSEPKLLEKFVADESSSFRLLLAHALLMGSLRINNLGLGSLPSLEARILHFLSVRQEVKSRRTKLDKASPSSLKALFKDTLASSDDSPPSNTGSKGNRIPPSGTSSFFFGTERASRNSSSREAASNNRQEEEESASTTAAAAAASEQNEEEGDDEASDSAAAHLREAAIVQMAELGLPRQWAELALSRVGGTNIEAAVHFCLERGGDMERLLAEESERRGPSSFLSSRRRGFGASRMGSSNLIRQLVEMGFPRHWCVEALHATRNNVDEALTWILTNGDRLSAEDEAAEEVQENEDDNEESDEEEENEDEEDEEESGAENDDGVGSNAQADEKSQSTEPTVTKDVGWSGICPIRFVSGRSSINPKTLDITGLPNGGFSSVGTKGVLLTSGKWYYEAEIKTAGCLQIGWADSSFVGHCQADRGDGCGDGPSSWAFDGWRRYRWHSTATEWGAKWAEGDIVGCLVDMDSMSVSFTLNGKGEEIGLGLAFNGEGFRPCSGVYACVSFNRREKLRLILGGKGTEPFKYPPPDGYRGIGEAIHDAIKERQMLLAEEKVLTEVQDSASDASLSVENKKYICDFSDGEHGHELFAWQHRYYGSDASVHLGSNRPGSIFGGSSGSLKTSKSSTVSTKGDNPTVADISSRLSKIFSKASKPEASEVESDSLDSNINLLRDAYDKIDNEVCHELREVCSSLCVLYSRKLVMHTMVSHSNQFSLLSFLPKSVDTPWSSQGAEDEVSRRLWQVLENCTSLQSSGWAGEAGAMAVAAEALGLGISSGENKSSSIPAGMCSVNANNDQVLLPCGGGTQFLTSAISPDVATSDDLVSPALTFAACSEYATGSELGGSLSFIRSSLQSAAASSTLFRQVLLAAVRRAIRVLAVTEYQSDEGSSEEEESDTERKRPESEDQSGSAPDARLASFLTGLLLSKPVCDQLSDSENTALRCGLFEAWCIGLLSASSPWRMVCAFTAAGILNTCPKALAFAIRIPSVVKYLGGLESTVLRRTWAERAAVPVCSKYSQALMELLTSVKRALRECPDTSLPSCIKVDAATPIPFTPTCSHTTSSETETSECKSWECSEGWVINNGWEVWTGSVEIMEVEWKTPPRSIVRTLMDGGEGPPLLREGCTVMRANDWDAGNEDGKNLYEQDKLEKEEQRRVAEKEEEERKAAEQESEELKETDTENVHSETGSVDPAVDEEPIDPSMTSEKDVPPDPGETEKKSDKPKKKKKKLVASKLPVGTVLSIEPWNGVPAMARRVRWHLTGEEGVYRYGGDGGRFDIIHVEVNEKETRVKKKHPPPETLEQCASRYGFGKRRTLNVLLRLRNCPLRNVGHTADTDISCDGILEWPDFGAGISVDCTFYPDGAISIMEKEVLYGSKDSGWESRFGQSSFVSGTVMIISPTHSSPDCIDSLSAYDELLGSNSFLVKNLRNKEDGGCLRVTSEMRLWRSKQSTTGLNPSLTFSSSQPPPICFDSDFHASSITLSKDKRSVTCATSDGRGVAFGNVGFTKGVHYWEVKLEKAEIGSVYIGVAEKPGSPAGSSQGGSYSFESQPRLNRWLGWGFVNFRATYTAGAERVYGAHCHAGDTVGVLLDCDAGRINYFIDGVKYGEHILNDLGCAFENVSPFGFNADGCGSGGAGQGAPSGVDGARNGRYPANGAVRPKALWPVIGLRHPGDRVTMSSKWMSSHGVDGASVVKNALAVDEILCSYEASLMPIAPKLSPTNELTLPQWFIEESFHEYSRWRVGRWLRSSTRGSGPCKLSTYGLDVDLDTSPFSCACASAAIGLPIAMLPGDRVDVKRSAGRILELQEEAIVLGTYQGRLFYRLVSQKSEGGSLMEGGGRAWFWDESEAVDGGLQLIGEGLGQSLALPKLSRFNPPCGGLKVVYSGGALVRSDLEIFDGSKSIGTVASGTVIPPNEVIERRLNSCGVVRYLIDHKPEGEGQRLRGWISSRIRGGKEEPIVEMLPYSTNDEAGSASDQQQYVAPEDSAREWYKEYEQKIELSKLSTGQRSAFSETMKIESVQEFQELLTSGVIGGMSALDSDSLIAATYGRIADALPHSSEGGCSFVDCALVLGASQPHTDAHVMELSSSIDAVVHEAATESLVHVMDKLPSTKSLMVRISMLRALNRRARYGLPWLPLRSAQEGSAILGGLSGFGTSLERAGRSWDSKSRSKWMQAPSTSSRLRNCREIIFTSTKKNFLESVLDATATPTPLSHDEYELPREVRTVRVNRLKARRAMASDDSSMKKKHSVFSQLQREMRGWSGATLRRGFVAKGHGGQKRAFKVKLVGEGVNDYSGPYREVFTDAMHEVTNLDPSGCSSLGVLQPSANNEAGVGEGRDLFVFALPLNDPSTLDIQGKNKCMLSSEEEDLMNSFSSLAHKKNENSREIEEALSYLGKLVGTACRHGIPVDLPLPLGVVWKQLTEENIDIAHILKEIDILACKEWQDIKTVSTSSPSDQVLATQRRLLNSFTEGMSSVLPVELLSMFTGEQLRDIVCGNPDIDVELLRRVVEYEGYTENDKVVNFFWEVLREMTTSERKQFLQFVWARNRLPLKESDFDAPFKIQRDTKTVNEDGDYPLPSASTCFFSLTLPEYPEKQVLKDKLLFAIENVTTMESDYVTNDVEVSEGWRGL